VNSDSLYCVMAYAALRKVLVSFLRCCNMQQDNRGLGMKSTEEKLGAQPVYEHIFNQNLIVNWMWVI
jgi:hypothetical protein